MDAQLIPVDSGLPIRLARGLTILGCKRSVSDIALSSARSSKLHCMICQTQGRVYVQDMGSANGTLVNRSRITEQTELHNNDILECGQERFVVRLIRDSQCSATSDIDSSKHESPLMTQVLEELHNHVPIRSFKSPPGGRSDESENWASPVFATDSTEAVPEWMVD